MVREAIHAAAVASLPNLLRLARTAIQSRNYREAYEYFTRVLEADADNWEAWSGKAEASGFMAGPQEVRLQEIVTCFANALQSAPKQEREKIEHKISEVIDDVAGRYYTHMRAALSPGFAEETYWQAYLAQLRNVVGALEETHNLIPKNASIVRAILHVCHDNRERVPYINRFGGVRSVRTIRPEMRAFIAERIARYSRELEILEPKPEAERLVTVADTASGPTAKQIIVVSLAIVLFLVAIGLLGSVSNSVHTINASSATSNKFSGTPEEKTYLQATLRYLTVHYEQCKSAATTMAAADGGGATLDEIRTALNTSRAAIERSWKDDFLPLSSKSPPSKFTDVDKKIRHVHESQEAAFDELLSYWKDRRTSHINTGADMFKQALIECDSTIKDLNNILDNYPPKKI